MMKITKSKEVLFLLSLIIGMATSVDIVINVTVPVTGIIANVVETEVSIFGVASCSGILSSSILSSLTTIVEISGSTVVDKTFSATITNVSVSTITSTSTVRPNLSYPRITSWTTVYKQLPCDHYDNDYSPKRGRYNHL